jgi:hypothetical protein
VSKAIALAVPAQRVPCPTWCTEHDAGENYCVSANAPIPGENHHGIAPHVGLMSHPDSGITIDIYRSADDVLTLDDAEHLAAVLLDMVAKGRSTARAGKQR